MARSGVVVTFSIILALHILRENVLLHDPVLLREEVDEDSHVALVSVFVLPLELHQH